MGKSAGKWIKTVLFGKKHSKSNYSSNVTSDKKNGAKTPTEDLARDSSVISDPSLLTRGTESLELENGISGSQCDAVAHVDQGIDSQSDDELVPVSDDEMRRQDQAATKTQAVFRGYLARRAFRALKGIIRLQALIRGHLVRRQAVATLRCMYAIVKLQALARGRRVRLSDAMPEFTSKFNVVAFGARSSSFLGSEILAVHPFINKLVITLPNAMPLSLQYDQTEPNSASNWLELWSVSHFWEPPPRTKKVTKTKPQRKQGGTHTGDSEAGKSKRTIRKISTTGHGEIGNSEMDKPKRNPRKVTSSQTQTEAVQEQSVSELERVKRSLRKVSAAAMPEKQEPETEKPQSVEVVSAPLDVSQPELVTSSGNHGNSDVVVVDKMDPVEAPLVDTAKDETVDMQQHDSHPVIEITSLENDAKMESGVSLDDELSPKEEQNRKENQKMRKRRSLPAKQEYTENISQNSPSVPSYMAATESAKAKLRAQGALKFSEDVAMAVPDYGNARRHSLPASTNGKISSLSPRIQKPVQANGKGATKTNKALVSSRDEKVVQPGWRR